MFTCSLTPSIPPPPSTVTTYMGEVHSRTSQNMDLVRERVQPYVIQAHGGATDKLGSISTLLKTQAEGLKGQLEATAEELQVTIEDKMNKISDIIAPLAAKFHEQIQTIMNKVKETSGNLDAPRD